jgi:hypothetical protein
VPSLQAPGSASSFASTAKVRPVRTEQTRTALEARSRAPSILAITRCLCCSRASTARADSRRTRHVSVASGSAATTAWTRWRSSPSQSSASLCPDIQGRCRSLGSCRMSLVHSRCHRCRHGTSLSGGTPSTRSPAGEPPSIRRRSLIVLGLFVPCSSAPRPRCHAGGTGPLICAFRASRQAHGHPAPFAVVSEGGRLAGQPPRRGLGGHSHRLAIVDRARRQGTPIAGGDVHSQISAA